MKRGVTVPFSERCSPNAARRSPDFFRALSLTSSLGIFDMHRSILPAAAIASLIAFRADAALAQAPAKAAPIFVNGMAQVVPAFQDSIDVDPPGALGRDELRQRSRRQEGSRARRRHASAPDGHRRTQGLRSSTARARTSPAQRADR